MLCVKNSRVLEACSESLRSEKRGWEVGLRGGKAGEETPESLTVPAHTNGSTRCQCACGARHLELGPCLVNGPGLDLYAEPQREIGWGPSLIWRTSTLLRARARGDHAREVCGKKDKRHFATRRGLSWDFEPVNTRLLRATFVLLDAFLSSMSHHQVLFLVLQACCLPLSARVV